MNQTTLIMLEGRDGNKVCHQTWLTVLITKWSKKKLHSRKWPKNQQIYSLKVLKHFFCYLQINTFLYIPLSANWCYMLFWESRAIKNKSFCPTQQTLTLLLRRRKLEIRFYTFVQFNSQCLIQNLNLGGSMNLVSFTRAMTVVSDAAGGGLRAHYKHPQWGSGTTPL